MGVETDGSLLITDPYRHKGVIDSLVKDDEGKPTGRYMVTPRLRSCREYRKEKMNWLTSLWVRSRKMTCKTGCRPWMSDLSTGLWITRRSRLKKFGINTRRDRSRGIWNRRLKKAWNEWSFYCHVSMDRDSIFNRTHEIDLCQRRVNS